MQRFVDLSTRAKLFIGFGLMLFFLALVIVISFVTTQAIAKAQKELFDRDFALVLNLTAVENNLNGQRVAVLTMMTADEAARRQLKSEVAERSQSNDQAIKKLQELTANDPEFREKISRIAEIRGPFTRTRDEQVIPLIEAGNIAEARAISLAVQTTRFNEMQNLTQDMQGRAKKRAEEALAQTEARVRQATTITVAVGLAAIALGVLMAVLLSRLIANPLRQISGVAEQIAAGDLGVEVASDHRNDEVGVLLHNFDRMTQSLQSVAGVAGQIAEGNLRVEAKPQSSRDVLGNAFSEMVQNLQGVIAGIADATNVLSTSAAQISASTSELAASATETAAAVNETTTTVEEIRQTAQVANEKAQHVAASAQHVIAISQGGRNATRETAEGMQRIREQMDSIAESMVRLSEQSQAIGEIIATVDDLAKQSNLLAVNAAIEAAKAGEQGKGFSVVASEVKSLADQSKQATMQVRTILNDIQKATGAAVMATEQGSKAVEAGVLQSAQAGESIVSLSDSVNEAATAATQIAASSQQQLVGMDQVVQAMESIKQASLQNVDGAKQLETAARNLIDLGQKLKEQVGRYKV